MAMTIHLDVVSAERAIYSGLAEFVVAPAEMGDVGITPRHTPLLTRLRPGEIKIRKAEGEEEYIYVSGGILEVQPRMITILSDTAARTKDLDEAAVMDAKRRAESTLADQREGFEFAKAAAELAEAVAQLRAIERIRKTGIG
jgi:F-type H+-transporting ATPase subunit epsilon